MLNCPCRVDVWKMEVYLHTFCTSALSEGEWSGYQPGNFNPGINRKKVEFLPLPSIDPSSCSYRKPLQTSFTLPLTDTQQQYDTNNMHVETARSFETSVSILTVKQQDAPVSQIIYSCKTLYIFRTVFPSIIRSSKLHIRQQTCVKQLLLPAASSR